MDVIGTTPGKEEVELRRDAYMDIGGRATHDPRDDGHEVQVSRLHGRRRATGGGRIASGTAIEEAKAEQQPRVESGTETESNVWSNCRGRTS